MEKILLINGISPYLYVVAINLSPADGMAEYLKVYLGIFFVQLILTCIISIVCKDKKKLAKITMINKFVQIPYYVLFFLFSFMMFIVGMGIMGMGLVMLPIFILIDFGVFLSTLIPEEICTIKLKKDGYFSTKEFVVYLIFNAFYVVDIILSVLIYKKYKNISGN